MFHVKHFALSLTAALITTMEAAAFIAQQPQNVNQPVAWLTIPSTSSNEEARKLTALGMQDLLLGWTESAEQHFRAALDKDPHQPLACQGLIIIDQTLGRELTENLARFKTALINVQMTPIEEFYVSTFAKLIRGNLTDAANDFATRFEKYGRDYFSAYWAIMLLDQTDALKARKLSQQLHAAKPDDVLATYLYEYITRDELSEEEINTAVSEVMLPWHPSAHLLAGHKFYNVSQFEKAAEFFKRTVELCEARTDIAVENAAMLRSAQSYLISSLWAAGNQTDAQKIRQPLNKLRYSATEKCSTGNILLGWEIKTLPLRLLISDAACPNPGDITAAARVATPAGAGQAHPLIHLRNCISACLQVRVYSARKNPGMGQKYMQMAQEQMRLFYETREEVFKQSPAAITPWLRALSACEKSIRIAQYYLYEDLREQWVESYHDVYQPQALLPPSILWKVPQNAE